MKAGLHVAGRPWGPTRVRGVRWGRLLSSTVLLVLAVGYLCSPYLTLWRLDRALVRNDLKTLDSLVDLAAVRGELARKLNKDEKSPLGPPSDAFIEWLEQGIRRDGIAALDRQVDLEWVRERLLAQAPPAQGMGSVLTRAFFDDPLHFSVRVGNRDLSPVLLRLAFHWLGWRVTAIYF